jgi:hypothetical protein
MSAPQELELPPGPQPSLITTEDVVQEIQRLFGGGPDSGLVIRVYGATSNEGAGDTFREMLASLQMYDDRYRQGSGVEVLVDAPDRATIARALSVLGQERHQKKILDHILTTFGRRLIDPLAAILDTTPNGTLMGRLSMMRDIFLAQIAELRMTPESQQILSEDVCKLMNDDYLAMVAEHEERVQRPRVTKLAQQILRLVGSTFHRALRRWPEHADQIAATIARRNQGKVRLREIPVLLRTQITNGIEEFLWVETSNDIEGSLQPLFAEHRNVMHVPPAAIDRDTYHEFAVACWSIIAEHC